MEIKRTVRARTTDTTYMRVRRTRATTNSGTCQRGDTLDELNFGEEVV
jgi:hypothetical protein